MMGTYCHLLTGISHMLHQNHPSNYPSSIALSLSLSMMWGVLEPIPASLGERPGYTLDEQFVAEHTKTHWGVDINLQSFLFSCLVQAGAFDNTCFCLQCKNKTKQSKRGSTMKNKAPLQHPAISRYSTYFWSLATAPYV